MVDILKIVNSSEGIRISLHHNHFIVSFKTGPHGMVLNSSHHDIYNSDINGNSNSNLALLGDSCQNKTPKFSRMRYHHKPIQKNWTPINPSPNEPIRFDNAKQFPALWGKI